MRTPKFAAAALATSAMVVVGCGGASDSTDGGGASGAKNATSTVSLVAYSTPQVVYDEIIPAFKQTADGKGVDFKTSYGASGDQSRAVEAGQKADVVSFSVEPDLTRLEDAGLVERERDTADRRQVKTRITKDGLALLARMDAPVDQMQKRMLGHLGERKLRALIELLEEVRESSSP